MADWVIVPLAGFEVVGVGSEAPVYHVAPCPFAGAVGGRRAEAIEAAAPDR
eukprot:CAMPEP_0119141792 /NCGR_PEP_ID=MMETSP1310-20130426/31612_1 /TAXON_ID=464262 /ORGANISM="Genus nov. species nov., Strain RCC2339" /LENGTH=50 /DNA_ID=CAMNT_0007133275 /DNA_START=58 /DNA_END=210 /DNA_ORIENTATION=-